MVLIRSSFAFNFRVRTLAQFEGRSYQLIDAVCECRVSAADS